jgi:hypothetical protein
VRTDDDDDDDDDDEFNEYIGMLIVLTVNLF